MILCKRKLGDEASGGGAEWTPSCRSHRVTLQNDAFAYRACRSARRTGMSSTGKLPLEFICFMTVCFRFPGFTLSARVRSHASRFELAWLSFRRGLGFCNLRSCNTSHLSAIFRCSTQLHDGDPTSNFVNGRVKS